MSSPLPPDHFLNQARPDFVVGIVDGFVDTTTLAAHDFDVDTRTGFMPPDPPISRLPSEWEPWEMILDQALSMKLQLAVKPGLTEDEMARSASWRESVRDNVSYFFRASLVIALFTYLILASRMCHYFLYAWGCRPISPVTHAFDKGPYGLRAVTPASSSCAHLYHAHLYPHTPT